MIRTPTVVVLGAGSNVEYGFPLGAQLRRMICGEFYPAGFPIKGPKSFGGVLADDFDFDLMREFGKCFYHSAPCSIDAFLEHRPEFIELGKAAIAAALIPCEFGLHIFNRENERLGLYGYLFDRLRAPSEQFKENTLSFVTFNYDRSLEYFLHTQLCALYNLTPEQSLSLLESIPIIHVYGELSTKRFGQPGARPFGNNRISAAVRQAAEGINIIAQGREDSPAILQARELLAEAQRVYVLGFGWDETNVARLALRAVSKKVFGLAYGMFPAEVRRIRKMIQMIDRFDSRFVSTECSCLDCIRQWDLD